MKDRKSKPYLVQINGQPKTRHATQEEAEAEYRRLCAEIIAARTAPPISTEPTPAEQG